MKEKYLKDDKMADLLQGSEKLLLVVSRFGIRLGVGDKTIEQVCKENNVDTKTFLTIINFTNSNGDNRSTGSPIDLKTLQFYLQNSHIYLLDFLLPHIRRHLIDALGSSKDNDITFLIIKFFDEYCQELRSHMEAENREIFSKTDDLLSGKQNKNMSEEIMHIHTSPIEQKLSELKSLIIKYYSSASDNAMVYNILQLLFFCEYDLYIHDRIETALLLPEVRRLEEENRRRHGEASDSENEDSKTQGLSQREKDIIIGVVKGLTNKEIADKLFISVNTVTTHRRNIAKKLNIHSPSGLTIYAIVNQLVDIKDLKL